MRTRLVGCFGGLFALFAIGFVLFADCAVGFGAWQMAQSADWPTTSGIVTESELRRERKSTLLHLRYTYTVNDRVYTGTRYDAGTAFLPKQKWPKVQSELPVGTVVTVSYDPANPGSAVLHPGLRPDILPVAFGLVPFNLIGFLIVGTVWNSMTRRRAFDPARDVHSTPAGLTARLNGIGRLALFTLSLFILSFASLFLVVVLLHSTWEVPPSWLLDGAILGGIVLMSTLIAAKWGGPRRLVEGVDGFTVPITSTGRKSIELTRAAVKHVEVLTETRQGNKGRTYEVSVVSLVAVEGRDRRTIRFAEYRDPADARALANWLLERIGKKSVL